MIGYLSRFEARFLSYRATAGLAQLVERPPCKRKVISSIPIAGTTWRLNETLHD